MGQLDGKVAFITGAGRGQGRSHAVLLAEHGADVIAVDIGADIPTVPYPMATPDDLAETARLVEQQGRRCVTAIADVRDIGALAKALDHGIAELGGVDIVLANAGVLHSDRTEQTLEQAAARWADAVGVMLTGVFNTLKVAQRPLVEQGRGGSIVITGSTAGLKGMTDGSGGMSGYTAAKHGVVGLAKGWAKLLGQHDIRVNVVHPTAVDTFMINNPQSPMVDSSNFAQITRVLPVDRLQPADVSAAILWLVSDAAFAVTGVALPLDAGMSL
ncbi:SDR family mycofactocin-dependent oxidoreductase [Prauserella sp. PE36]|uniref:NAD(P)-dependent oxidoreductase n=1 Tax=Prauserella endophytica TaxID=1592324 RepID=A0ABY2S6V2_9PSEU|nr:MULTISPECIES: mycofactocin-coupled SDR family oxidoreductase [Prauserella]PXY33250.1 3-ketoacyl-ACP reductase [Prauserella coralliicola]RBM16197.1 SDR family mycofactocin-dependent oxidoreductase [Prauserella sp. PE36]TKG70830.1 NAD(P)-dependent oxidoreductase [Prauserella endophytica]